MNALAATAGALVRESIPYRWSRRSTSTTSTGSSVLFLPRAVVMSEATERGSRSSCASGGTLVCESECGAFTPAGIYRYPEDRFTARLAGVAELGRRTLDGAPLEVRAGAERFALEGEQWLTPMRGGEALATAACGPVVVSAAAGQGRVIFCGSYLGGPYLGGGGRDFERFVAWACDAHAPRPFRALEPEPGPSGFVHIVAGRGAKGRVVFVFPAAGTSIADVWFREGFWKGRGLRDALSGAAVALTPHESGVRARVAAADLLPAVLVDEG